MRNHASFKMMYMKSLINRCRFFFIFLRSFLGPLDFFFLLFLANPSFASPGQKAACQADRFGKNKGNIGEDM